MAETTNSLVAFLNSSWVIFGESLSTRENVFIDAFSLYCKEMNIKKERWSYQYCIGPFQNVGITVDKHARAKKDSKGVRISGTFFNGVSIVPKETPSAIEISSEQCGN